MGSVRSANSDRAQRGPETDCSPKARARNPIRCASSVSVASAGGQSSCRPPPVELQDRPDDDQRSRVSPAHGRRTRLMVGTKQTIPVIEPDVEIASSLRSSR
jgi:hypothetical protein